MISSKSECETAASTLLSYASAYALDGTYNVPSGCIVNSKTGWLGWYDINNAVPCGSLDPDDSRSTYNCLCKYGKIKNFNIQKMSGH